MIKFLDTDFQTILDAMLASWEAQAGTPVPAAGLLRHMFTVFGYRETMIRILTNYAASRSFLKYADDEALDLIAELVGIERLAGQAARVTVRVNWAAPLAVDYTVPAGTRFQTSDGLVIFESDSTAVADAGDLSVDVLCTASVLGTDGNGYPLGSVNTLLDTLSILPESIENVVVSEGGGDVETDDRFRERISERIQTSSSGGTLASYRAIALGYSSEIVSVDAYSPNPGEVVIYPLLRLGEIPAELFISGMQTWMDDDENRIVCDTVTVSPPIAQSFSVNVRLDFYASESALQGDTIVEAERLIAEWAASIKEKLNRDIIPEEIVNLCQGLPGVYRVRVLSPAWTQVGTGQFPSVSSISVSVGNEYSEIP